MKIKLSDKKYRDAFVEEGVKTGIAFQVRALRDEKGWSQATLGENAGKPQNVISRIEDPDYGKFTIRTLLNLASAFDVALQIRFVSFGQLLRTLKNSSPNALAVPSYDEEQRAVMAAAGVSTKKWYVRGTLRHKERSIESTMDRYIRPTIQRSIVHLTEAKEQKWSETSTIAASKQAPTEALQ